MDSEFFNCIDLKTIVLPMSVKYIGEDAFERCISLSTITIQNPNVSIGRNAFDGCPEDAKVTLGGKEITISDLKNKNNMKLTESQLRNIILKETKKVLNEISNELLANAAYSAKDKGRRCQRGVFFDRIANNLNSKYKIEDVFEFFSAGSSVFAKVYYDYDLEENFMSSFVNGELMLRDTYDNETYTLDEFEQNFAGDYQTSERRKIMAGLRNLEDILKKANQDELEPQFNDDISDNEIRVINSREK